MYQFSRGYASNLLIQQMAEALIVIWLTNENLDVIMLSTLNDNNIV